MQKQISYFDIKQWKKDCDNVAVTIIEKPATKLMVTTSSGDAGDVYGNDFFFEVLHLVVFSKKTDNCRVINPSKLSFQTMKRLENEICGRNYVYRD